MRWWLQVFFIIFLFSATAFARLKLTVPRECQRLPFNAVLVKNGYAEPPSRACTSLLAALQKGFESAKPLLTTAYFQLASQLVYIADVESDGEWQRPSTLPWSNDSLLEPLSSARVDYATGLVIFPSGPKRRSFLQGRKVTLPGRIFEVWRERKARNFDEGDSFYCYEVSFVDDFLRTF